MARLSEIGEIGGITERAGRPGVAGSMTKGVAAVAPQPPIPPTPPPSRTQYKSIPTPNIVRYSQKKRDQDDKKHDKEQQANKREGG
jgi:hypothetical protein